MKKVLIFENEVYIIENTFKTINLLSFDEELEIEYLKTSQEIGNISNIENYELVIIDIDLSVNSKKDGIGIIKEISTYNSSLLKKVIVLTGHSKVSDKLKSLSFDKIPVLKKPPNIDELTTEMKKILDKH